MKNEGADHDDQEATDDPYDVLGREVLPLFEQDSRGDDDAGGEEHVVDGSDDRRVEYVECLWWNSGKTTNTLIDKYNQFRYFSSSDFLSEPNLTYFNLAYFYFWQLSV